MKDIQQLAWKSGLNETCQAQLAVSMKRSGEAVSEMFTYDMHKAFRIYY